ncbi:MAG: hypothetical protein ACYSWQ_26045 [Planctomycetota bacterium]|jgi:hypothetical protein
MKESPQSKKLDQVLRSSKLAAGGFMGTDPRSAAEVIDADTSDLSRLGHTAEQVASRMQSITDAAKAGLGTWVQVDEKRRAVVAEARGFAICPWPHSGRYVKRVTTVELLDSAETVRWSDLNIHLIAEHGFFEGRGSTFRIEPAELVAVIF